MDIKPIKSDKDYQKVLDQIDLLMEAKEGTLDVLTTLVEAYEAKSFPISAPDAISAIQFVMEQRGLTRKDIEPYFGNKSRISEVLNKKRNLTLPMIRKLRVGLNIPADILIKPL